MDNYIRLCNSTSDKGQLIKSDDLDKYISYDKEFYVSTYYYNEEQYNNFQKTGSVKGVKDVSTNKVWFDFDSGNPELSRQSAIETIKRLEIDGIPIEDIEIYFSGNKGYHLILNVDRVLIPKEVEAIALKYASDLQGFDPSLYDYTQILRVPGTKHGKSGLHKIPLTYNQLTKLQNEEIRHIASSIDNIKDDFQWKMITPKDEFYKVKLETKKSKIESKDINWDERPTHWKPYKWALLQGFFEAGERHNALLIVAATCRSMNYDKETAYYMCKSAIKKQAQRTGQNDFPKEELYNDILKSVYSESWLGGSFSPKNNPWLAKYCERMGIPVDREEIPCVEITEMFDKFKDYSENFDKNVIKTGIPSIDENILLVTSTSNGLLGQPGCGKTTLAMEILKNTSNNNINSLFMSMDMGLPIVTAKMIQRYMGVNFKEAMHIVKTDPVQSRKILDMLKEEYKNVSFNFKSGVTVESISDIIKQQEDITGKKINLVVSDYLENITDKFSDSNANYALIANKMKDLANEHNICSIMLLQTQKHASDIADPLLSMRQIKGASTIEQSMSVIMTAWRPGYNPKTIQQDKFMSVAAVKNRFGPLWMGDLGWKGKTGEVFELSNEQKLELKQLLQLKEKLKVDELKNSGWS